jgi:hypothetical protein
MGSNHLQHFACKTSCHAHFIDLSRSFYID